MSSSIQRKFLKQFGSMASPISGAGLMATVLEELNIHCCSHFSAPQKNDYIKWSMRNSPNRIERHLLLSKLNMPLSLSSNFSYEKKKIVNWDPVTMKLLN